MQGFDAVHLWLRSFKNPGGPMDPYSNFMNMEPYSNIYIIDTTS